VHSSRIPSPASRDSRRADLARALLLAVLGLTLSACRGGGAVLHGGSTATAGDARQLFEALAARYTTPQRLADYDAARDRIAHNAFVPSNAWKDSAIWTARPSAGIRQVHAFGWLAPGGYRVRAVPGAPTVRALGDSRHSIGLMRVGGSDDVYRWDTTVEYLVGPIAPDRVAGVFPALLASIERRTEREIRADYRGAFPRTTAAMGRYASLDTVRATPLGDGSSAVRIAISLHAGRLARTHPALAAYLAKYGERSRARFIVRDRLGTASPATWMVMEAVDYRITIDARVRDGVLAPSHGPRRAFPDTLELATDLIAAVGPFTVGLEGMRTELVRTHTPREQTWTITARREPSWKLPLLTERLIRSPLRRPFEGAGSTYAFGFRSDGEGTVFHRHGRVTVQESAILRFVNRLGSRAFGDISPQVEAEEARFLRELFTAMRDDVLALGPSSGG